MRRGICSLALVLVCTVAAAGDNVVIVAMSGGDFSDPAEAADWVADRRPDANNRFVILVEPGMYKLDRPVVMPDYTTLKGHSRQQTRLVRRTADRLPPHGAAVLFDGLRFASIESLTVNNVPERGEGAGIGAAVYIEDCYSIEIKDCRIEASGGGDTVEWIMGLMTSADYLKIESSEVVGHSNYSGVIGLDQLGGDVLVKDSLVEAYGESRGAVAVYQDGPAGGFPTLAVHGSRVMVSSLDGAAHYYYRTRDGSGGFYHCQIERGALTNVASHHYVLYCHDGGLLLP